MKYYYATKRGLVWFGRLFVRNHTGLDALAGTRMPWWMGVARIRYDYDVMTLAIIPLNYLIHWWCSFWLMLRACKRSWWEDRLLAAYQLGYDRGRGAYWKKELPLGPRPVSDHFKDN